MNGAREIPRRVRERQAQASDPTVAAFVAANAGSGKTHVLAQRVIRLMLDGGPGGVDPSKILCITFTKAAAANMALRVYGELRSWIGLDDAALDAALTEIGVTGIDGAKRRRARRLFAAALETPGGLKVQTIHAFCTRILQQFPFEAGVAARFTVLEERAQSEMLEHATNEVLLEAAAAPDSDLGRALGIAAASAADTTFRDVIREAIARSKKLDAWFAAAGGVAAAVAQLAKTLGIGATDQLADVDREIVEGPHLPSSRWAEAASELDTGSPSDTERAANLRDALAGTGPGRVADYLCAFFTDTKPRDNVVTKKFAANHPVLAQQLASEQVRLVPLRERRHAIICRERTNALLTIAEQVIARYRHEKDRRGLLDYDDLIEKTQQLLERGPGWVHYKLDLGLDHILVDEAQDTSEAQWNIVKHLAAEFTAGSGAHGLITRTVFAVGDEKQSIFSFQGAAPREYAAARAHFEAHYQASEVTWRVVQLDHSFRSGDSVLGAVDAVFKPVEIYRSITTDPAGMLGHLALPGAVPGIVEVWPLIKADAAPPVEPWDAPFDALSETSATAKLAQKIAAAVRGFIDTATPVGAARMPMRPGDILVLVRQRGPLFDAIIRALKLAGVAVAGADRLMLTEHIAVVDLMALADALLLPEDDLALAIALKSPLFGFDDDRLFDLAHGRSGSLRAVLAARSKDNAAYDEADALLRCCAERARHETPFAFFAWLLGPEGGRRKIFSRLGFEAADALDEFLTLALDHERNETPSLQGFLNWLRSADTQVKRDMAIARDEVRVMTVHGAKGLEAPVVILADTTTPPKGVYPPRLIEVPRAKAPPGAPPCIVWAARKAMDVPAVANARAATLAGTEHEYRRLLYVAMTRAAERLIVCGYEGKRTRPQGCWYDLIVAGLKATPEYEECGSGDAAVWRYRKAPAMLDLPAPAQAAQAEEPVDEPAWLTTPAPAEPDAPVTLSPSAAYDEIAAPRLFARRGEDIAKALARGRLVHRLMQSLPDVLPERREAAAQNFVARAGADFSAEERDELVRAALALFADPRFAPLFAPGSRAEVPIVGRLARTGRPDALVSGQIDRLAVNPDGVLIADYKTDRDPPQSPEAAPAAYVTQLALYRAVLQRIYPDRPIRAALVWTNFPSLMEFSAAVLDTAVARVTSP